MSKRPLKTALENPVRKGTGLWESIREGPLARYWCRDLGAPANESKILQFWEFFGIDRKTIRHDPAEWQNLIFPQDPDPPYDQPVRRRHRESDVPGAVLGLALVRSIGLSNDGKVKVVSTPGEGSAFAVSFPD